jgi:hypothetical protein
MTLVMHEVLGGVLILASVMLSHLVAVVIVGLVGGLLPALAAAVAAAALVGYYFIQPVEAFTIANPDNLVALVAFLIAGTLGSPVGLAARRTQETETLATGADDAVRDRLGIRPAHPVRGRPGPGPAHPRAPRRGPGGARHPLREPRPGSDRSGGPTTSSPKP